MSHYEERLEEDLNRIRQSVRTLGEHAEAAIADSVQAFLTGDSELAYRTVLGDHRINRESRDVDERCHAFIARHLPSAGHLRLISSAIRVNIALERVGDYGVTIARESRVMSKVPEGESRRRLEALAAESKRVLDQAIRSFVDGNADIARATMPAVNDMSTQLDAVYDHMLSGTKKRRTREIVASFVVFVQLKRVADQAKNICDQTLFYVDGQSKPMKVNSVLFADNGPGVLARLAELIARKNYPDDGVYASTGKAPADQVPAALDAFLDSVGIDTSDDRQRSFASYASELNDFDVIVNLQGFEREALEDVPFHTSVMNWAYDDLAADDSPDNEDLAIAYRALRGDIDELMGLLTGKPQSS